MALYPIRLFASKSTYFSEMLLSGALELVPFGYRGRSKPKGLPALPLTEPHVDGCHIQGVAVEEEGT